MTQSYPPIAVFPDLNCILRLPTGAEYRGKLRQHPANDVEGEHWYEGYLRAQAKDHVTADTTLKDRFTKDGARPGYFPAASNVEPLRLKLNRLPQTKRTDKNADTLVGELWTNEGLWTIVASPSASASLHLAGTIVPSKHEMTNDGSRIKHYAQAQAPAPQAEAPAVKSKPARPAAARPA